MKLHQVSHVIIWSCARGLVVLAIYGEGVLFEFYNSSYFTICKLYIMYVYTHIYLHAHMYVYISQ